MISLNKIVIVPRLTSYLVKFGLAESIEPIRCPKCDRFIEQGSVYVDIDMIIIHKPSEPTGKGTFHLHCLRGHRDGEKVIVAICQKLRGFKRRKREPDLVQMAILELAQ